MSEPILRARDLVKTYPVRGTRQTLTAVAGVSLDLHRGETLGIVGESGCGKSTLARLLVRLEQPSSGSVELEGEDITALGGQRLRELRRRVQMVFQDPYASLNPRQTVGRTLSEVIEVHRLRQRSEWPSRVAELLEMVRLRPAFASRYPHQLSGGQRQRVGIARALAVQPEVLILDEPVSALDVSVQSGIMNLLAQLRDELDVAYVFISHDLGMVRHISDRIAVMYLGRVVETGSWEPVSDRPLHPYTLALQEAVPVADPVVEATRRVSGIVGEVPDPANPPTGCPFHPRCPLAERICLEVLPPLLPLVDSHSAACHVAARRFVPAS
ncbi:MAG TPA: oligopeptide/dipeptide ABC transporter ATP-binding protein [Acidimicrobiia bacterium]|jgi:oligopeptide/dipeptide ABC transporter ATP-binding protein|nr:oligopeptide/dipeptide ABC transporter ATP-binding protein [Acidimicrobiia bacterium]